MFGTKERLQHLDEVYFQSIEYSIKEDSYNLDGKKVNNLYEAKIVGLNNALDKARNVIERAIHRKMSVIERKELKENMAYHLPSWHLTIERV